MPLPIQSFRAALLAFAATMLAAAPLAAQSFEPDLGQTLDWLESARPGEARVPADSYELTRHPIANDPIYLPLDEVPGKPFNVVDPPPLKRAYYKYPFYLALGLPRDLVDATVGFVGFIPIVNLPIVGIGYEVVPTQVLFRDYRDWHGYGGTRNKNGHGWIDSDGWGWFPNYNQTRWESVDKGKLERYEAENAVLSAELQGLNREIDAHNDAILARQKTARDYAMYSLQQGQPREAVAWILPAHNAYPLDEEIQGVLVASLATYADDAEAPEWVEPLLWEKLTASLSRVQRASEARLTELHAAKPEAASVARALVYIKTVMGDRKGALAVAAASYQQDTTDPDRARLYFEAAMTARDPEQALAAFKTIESAHPERAGVELLEHQLTEFEDGLEIMRVRMGLLIGEAAPVHDLMKARVRRAPADPYNHYYLGCTVLSLAANAPSPGPRFATAGAHFEQASLLANNRPLRVRSDVALSYVRSLVGPERNDDEAGSSGFAGLNL